MGLSLASLSAQTTLTVEDAQLTIRGPVADAFFAQPLAGGDLDGDGLAEVITAASEPGDGLRDRVFVFRGAPDFISSRVHAPEVVSLEAVSAELEILAATEGDLTASSIAVGDVNGDGVDDLLLAAPWATAGGRIYAGIVHVLLGGADFFGSPVIDLAAPGSWDVRIFGPSAYADTGGGGPSLFGGGFDAQALAVGNLNGDSFGDLVIGAHNAGALGGFGYEGMVFVLFGRAFTSGSTFDLATPGGHDVRICGAAAGDEMGEMVAVGDVSGDGLDDLIIGDSHWAPSFSLIDVGRVHILRGRASWPQTIDLASAAADITLRGTASYDEVGASLALGDLNGDGVSDLAIGAPGLAEGVHAYLGGVRFTGSGSFTLAQDPGDFAVAGFAGGSLGSWPIAAADVDGDGLDDLLLGQRDAPVGGVNQAGAIDVVRGQLWFPPGQRLDLDAGQFDFRVHGTLARDMIGTWTAAADTDGDGFAEILGGSSFRGDDRGAVWVINAVSASTTAVPRWALFR